MTQRLVLAVLLLSVSIHADDMPPIGLIELYGLRTISVQQVHAALNLSENNSPPLNPNQTRTLERQLETVPGVVRARLMQVCCTDGKTVLFVGIQETGTPQLTYRTPPTKPVFLPPEAIALHQRFETALQEAVQKGDSGDDLSQGHSLMANPEARAVQEQFVGYAAAHLDILRSTLRDSKDAGQRAIAAWILGYSPDKRAIVPDLLEAVEDADDGVRNNATRALGAIATLAGRRPELGIAIPPDRFIRMLESVDWLDRNKALMVLQALSERRSAQVLEPLRAQARAALIEMARWKSHGLSAFLILGRLAGMEDKDIFDAWGRNDRESVIAKAAALPPRMDQRP